MDEDSKTKEVLSTNVKKLMKEKIDYFFEHIEVVYGEIGNEQNEIINQFRRMAQDYRQIEKAIAEMWISENLNLFTVCNALILADLYYIVVSKAKNNPPFYQNAGVDLSKDKIEEKLKILWYYWSWLWFMSIKYGGARINKVKLFRGLGFWTDNQYEKGSNYRFISFQSCSTDIN